MLTYKYHLFTLELLAPEESFHNLTNAFFLFNLFLKMPVTLLEECNFKL